MRDRLIELVDAFVEKVDIKEWYSEELDERLADHLLSEGVIVPPVRVGGNMYTLNRGRVKEWKVCFCGLNWLGALKFHIADEGFKTMLEVWDFSIGKTVFLTREEAEKALERSKNDGT